MNQVLDTILDNNLQESVLLVEKLITFGGKAYPKFGNVVIMAGGAGCHGKGEKIMMNDFSLKNVEDINIGDQLMGPDGKKRNVVKLHSGRQTMLKVSIKGIEEMIFNKDHVHSFIASYSKNGIVKDKIYNMTYDEYLELSPTKRNSLKLYFVDIINSNEKELPIDPYVLGYWLGDGTVKTPNILVENKYKNSLKSELEKRLYGYTINEVISHHENCTILSITTGKGRNKNDIRNYLTEISKDGIKRIPEDFFSSSEKQRFELLSGLIDSDGYNHKNTYEIITKFPELKEGIMRLCNSLGLRVFVSNKNVMWNNEIKHYYRIRIKGKNLENLNLILAHKKYTGKPNKNHLRVGNSIKFELIGEANYYGFEVDGDNLYVMGNGLVTHNSGKGFVKSQLLGVEGVNFDVDELKRFAAMSKGIQKKVKEEMGLDIAELHANMKNPDNVSKLHEIVGIALNLTNKKQIALFASILSAHPDRKPNIIFDTTLRDIQKLANLTRQVKEVGYKNENIHIVWVINDIEVAKEQNANRKRVVPVEILVNTHRGVSQTMMDVIDMGKDIKKYLDGDIVFAFNKVKVDNNIIRSDNGGFALNPKVPSSFFYIKKSGKPVLSKDKISKDIRMKIAQYVPKNVDWD